MRLFSSVSLWALVAFVTLFALQTIEFADFVLMMVGGPWICGLYLHGFLISLFVEAVIGRVPRFLLLIPISAYGAYYGFYIQQDREISTKSIELKRNNPAKVLDFNLSQDALVYANAEELVKTYSIPAAYQPDPNTVPDGFQSYRLLRSVQCAQVKEVGRSLFERKSYDAVYTFGVTYENKLLKDICLLRMPEKPDLSAITVTQRRAPDRQYATTEEITEFRRGGNLFATFKTASVQRLPLIPLMAIGCDLIVGPKRCFADFVTHYEKIDAIPDSIDKTRYDTPESVVLGLSKYTRADFDNLTVNSDISEQIRKINAYPETKAKAEARAKADMLARFIRFVQSTDLFVVHPGQFSEITVDGDAELPKGMNEAVLRDAAALVPYRGAMVARFAQIVDAGISVSSRWLQLLAEALTVLPRDAFGEMPDADLTVLLKALSQNGIAGYYPRLYQRTGDAGVRTQQFFEQGLSAFRDARVGTDAVLALCRIGSATATARAFLKERYLKSDNVYELDRNSALFVTLLKLRETEFLDSHPVKFANKDADGWYQAVKEDIGRTALGPNNCHAWDKSGFRDNDVFVPLMAGLRWQDKQWVASGVH